MKKLIMLALTAILLGTTALFAQKPERRGKEMERTQITAEKRADHLAKELNLTDKQKAEVLALFEKQDAERAKKQAEAKQENAAKREAFIAERKTQDAELEKIIGTEKFQLLQQKRAERQEKMKERRQHQ